MGISRSQAQVNIKNKTTNELIPIRIGDQIKFELLSDSALDGGAVEFESHFVNFTDSTLILSDEEEIKITDFKYITIVSKSNKRWRAVSAPFIIAGGDFMVQELNMFFFEKDDSPNKREAPFYIAGGGLAAIIATVPFLKKDKKYELVNSNWEILLP